MKPSSAGKKTAALPAVAPARAKSPVRERILTVASKLVRQHGPSGATARAICEQAGVTAPTLYHYFNDLNGLYTEILTAVFVEYLKDEPPDEVAEPMAMVDDIWDRLMHTARTDAGIVDLFNRQLSNGQAPDIVRSNYERLTIAFEELSKSHPMKVTARTAAHMFWAGAQGMASLIVASRHGIPYPEGAAEAVKAALLQGIFAGDPAVATTPRRARPARS